MVKLNLCNLISFSDVGQEIFDTQVFLDWLDSELCYTRNRSGIVHPFSHTKYLTSEYNQNFYMCLFSLLCFYHLQRCAKYIKYKIVSCTYQDIPSPILENKQKRKTTHFSIYPTDEDPKKMQSMS